MSNINERDREVDGDLLIDGNEFRKMQFDVFKHKLLECVDEADDKKCEHLILDTKLKKDIVNTIRRLEKAIISMEIFKNGESVEYIEYDLKNTFEKIGEILEQLKEMVKTNEFSSQNIELPEYNQTDMELLFGKQNNDIKLDTTVDPLEWLRKNNKEHANKINELLGAGEIMLNEWNEIKNSLKAYE